MQAWFKQALVRLKAKLLQSQNYNCLREQFQKADINNNGDISVADFKTSFLALNLGFTVNEINRLARLVQKNE